MSELERTRAEARHAEATGSRLHPQLLLFCVEAAKASAFLRDHFQRHVPCLEVMVTDDWKREVDRLQAGAETASHRPSIQPRV